MLGRLLAQLNLERTSEGWEQEQGKGTGWDHATLLPPAYQDAGRKQKQKRMPKKEIASLWIQGRSPSRGQGERNSLLRKEKWLSRTGMGEGRAFTGHTLCSQQAPFSQGSLFLKLPSWSGFCLVWRSSNLTANFSRLEKQLTGASEL